jgi:uncharacterized protein (TIGR03083 family)
MSTNPQHLDPITELRYALAQSDTANPAQTFRRQLLASAMTARTPGVAVDAYESISGLESFRRLTARLSRLLADLPAPAAWATPAIRDLDVQGLVGHLIGVEQAFAGSLLGDDAAARADHVASTQPSAVRQQGRSPQETFDEWALATERTIGLLEEADPDRPIHFHGIQLGLDTFLVVRSFEIWTHDEDIRRALGRAEIDPDPEILTRMTGLATTMLPVGIALTREGFRDGAVHDTDTSARLVLTGPGGGSWDVPLQSRAVRRAAPGARIDGHIVVDSAAFCRVVANRADGESSGAVVSQDAGVADLLLRGAAALALD